MTDHIRLTFTGIFATPGKCIQCGSEVPADAPTMPVASDQACRLDGVPVPWVGQLCQRCAEPVTP